MEKCGKKCGIFKILQKSKTRKASNHRRLRVSIIGGRTGARTPNQLLSLYIEHIQEYEEWAIAGSLLLREITNLSLQIKPSAVKSAV